MNWSAEESRRRSTPAPTRTVAPTFEPVTLAQAKKQLELPAELADHDDHVSRLIELAREQVENDTSLVLPQATYVWKFDEWPVEDFIMNRRPVQSVTSITYVDNSGSVQTVSSSLYELDTYRVDPSIRLKYDQTWPTARGHENDIVITAVCGHSSASLIPVMARHACLLIIAREFTERTGRADKWDQEGYDRLIRRMLRSTYP